MVVIAVLSIVIGLIYSIFISQVQTSTWRARIAERGQNLKAAMNVMTGDLMRADGIEYTSGLCNTTVSLTIGSETLTYYKTGDALIRNSTDTGQTTLAENITDLGFECFDRSGNGMLNVNATSAIEVRRVSIALTGETAKPRPGTTTKAKQTITSSVELRNIPQTAGKGCGVLYFDLTPKEVSFCNPPGNQATISIYLCDLKGQAMGGTVKIFPREPQPVTIQGASVTQVDNTAVLEISDPGSGIDCKDATTEGIALVNATAASALPAGTGIEMVAVWRPSECTYDITTSRSLSVAQGEPYKYEAGLEIFPAILNACQSTQQAVLNATVLDNCENGISGQTVAFDVLDSGGNIVTGDPDWGDISNVTDMGDGLYTALYNAGNVARPVELQAYTASIVNTSNQTVTNTVTLQSNEPYRLDLISPSGGSANLLNCLNFDTDVTFDIRDECSNIVTTDELSNLSAWVTSGWDPDPGVPGGMGPITKDGNNYSAIYNTSTTNCGPTESRKIYVEHADISDPSRNIEVFLNLEQCPYPGVVVNVESPARLNAGCPSQAESKKVTAQILTSDPMTGACEPAADPADVTFELRSVGHDGLNQGWGSTAPRNGRFLDETGTVGLATRTRSANSGLAITNVIAWDAEPGDRLYVHATADIEPYGHAEYVSSEYAIDIVNSASTLRFLDSSFSDPVDLYDVPDLVPTAETGNVFVELSDCDENGNINVVNSVSVDLDSFVASSLINSLTVTLNETSANSGIFNGVIPMKRVDAPNTILVNSGGIINATYTDADDGADTASDSVTLTGCAEMKAVDASDNEKTSVVPDDYPYDTGYPDGSSAFHLRMLVPEFAGDGIINSVSVHTCTTDTSAGTTGGDEDSVTLTEEASDNGILRIDHALFTGSYIYVGRDTDPFEDRYPTPSGDGAAGTRVTETPDTITIVYPENPSDPSICDIAHADVQNLGCYTTVDVADVQLPTVSHTAASGMVNGPVSFTIDASDGGGTLSSVGLVIRCISGSCTTGSETTTNSYTPGTSTFSVSGSFDSSLYPDGDYEVFARATDDASNTATSTATTVTIENDCLFNPLTVTVNITNTVTVEGQFLLNGSPNKVQDLLVEATDGTASDSFSVSNDSDGAFSWTSTESFPDKITVGVSGRFGSCSTSSTLYEDTDFTR